jgi:hypothetical protein
MTVESVLSKRREAARHPSDNRRGQVPVSSLSTPPEFKQGRGKRIDLTRAERYWIQHRLELIGSARTASENELLRKVHL